MKTLRFFLLLPALRAFALLNLLLWSFQISQAQSWLWAQQPNVSMEPHLGGEGSSVASDQSGNVYETGSFEIDSLAYASNTLYNTSFNSNFFLVKYNANGVAQWARQAILQNATSECGGNSVTVDRSGNVYVTGSTVDTVIFGGTKIVSLVNYGVFLAKYDPNGNLLWITQSHAPRANGNRSGGASVVTDPGRNVYITGEFADTITFGAYTLTAPASGANFDLFLVKYDSTGNVIWARQGNFSTTAGNAGANAVTVDAFKSVYITGSFSDTLTLGANTLISSSGIGDMFLAKYDANGNILWATQSKNNLPSNSVGEYVSANALTCDRWGNVYLTGNYEDSISFGSHMLVSPVPNETPYGNVALVKYDSSGNFIWAKTADPLVSCAFTGWGLSSDTFNHIYLQVGGWKAYPSTNFSIKFGGQTITSPGNKPSYEGTVVLELDTGGNALCGSSVQLGGSYKGGIAADPSGKYAYVGGYYHVQYTSLVVGPDTLVVAPPPVPGDVSTVPFVLKWQPCEVKIPLSVSISKTNVTCNGLCNGMASATGSGGTAPYKFVWNTNPVDTAQAISKLCMGGYSVTVTDSTGATASSGISISQPIALVSTISSAKDTLCAGDTATLSVTGNTANLVWQASLTGSDFTNIPGVSDSVYSFAPIETSSYRVTAGNGVCSDTSMLITLVINPLPVPVVAASDSIFCSGDSALLCTTRPYISYKWNTNDSVACMHTKDAGNFYVTVTDNNGCTAESNHLSISVYPVPSVSLSEKGDTLSSSGQNKYQWLLNDSIIANATEDMYVAREPGLYSVQVTDTNGCTTQSKQVEVTAMGLSLMEAGDQQVLLYPNPFSVGSVQLTVGGELVSSALDVYDGEGRIVFQSQIKNLKSKIDLDVPRGVYWLRIYNEKVSVVRKLVKI